MRGWSGSADLSPAARDNAEPSRIHARAFALSALQLGLLLVALHGLEIEAGFDLSAILPVIGVGYGVHAWLPARWKLPFFLFASLAGFLVVLGPAAAATVFALGLALFGVCHLPVHVGWRVAALLGCAAAVAALRAGVLPLPWSPAVLPLLCSLFVFRLAIYLYDEHTSPRPASVWMRLSYFFLLPNVVFLLFPVVDYRTFQRTYYERPASAIHERGLRWILRGILHLLAYRVVYAYLYPDPTDVVDLAGVVQFVCSSYLLYLRISGHFHLAVGILHLFGFRLPETNYAYWLSTSFSDCWRRTNIYWTEFMKKLVYFPAYMRLRKHGTLFALVVATLLVFAVTWCLHAIQWFWLQGELPASSDGLFWGVAGALALGSVVLDARRGRRDEVRTPGTGWGSSVRSVLRAALVFVPTAVIWSLWSSPSFGEWLDVLSMARHSTPAGVLALLGTTAAVLAVATVVSRLLPPRGADGAGERHPLRNTVQWAACGALALLGFDPVPASLGPRTTAALAPLVAERAGEHRRERAGLSYYDRLLGEHGSPTRTVWEPRFDPNDRQAFVGTGFVVSGPPPIVWEFAPLRRVNVSGYVVETNRHGMRDKDYELAKPPRTFRLAVLGSCVEMGVGVDNDEVWDELLERRLTRELGGDGGRTYEILNFSAAGYSLLNQYFVLRERVLRFSPDVVLVSNHVGSIVDYLRQVLLHPRPWPAELTAIVDQAGLEPAMEEKEIRGRLVPLRDRIDHWALSRIAEECRAAGAVPVWLEIPDFDLLEVRREVKAQRAAWMREQALSVGFQTITLAGAFGAEDLDELTIPELGHCPNARGHRRLADRLHAELVAQPSLLGEP